MVFAAISDLLTMTISNRVSIALVVLFVGMAFACGLSATEIAWHLACGALTLVLTFFLFARGWIGGGDAKLAAATAIWLGFEHIGDYAFSASVLGACLALTFSGSENGPCQASSRHANGSPICWIPPPAFRMASPSPAPAFCFIPAPRSGLARPTRSGSANPSRGLDASAPRSDFPPFPGALA